MKPPIVMTIAGSDPSGGAGLQADLKTIQNHGCYGTSVVTLLTVQNTQGVQAIEVMDPELVLSQLEIVIADLPPAATKTGALGSAAIIRALAAAREMIPGPLVVDPVMVSKTGNRLMNAEAVRALKEDLLPLADIVTPNVHEARELTGIEITDEESLVAAGNEILKLGPKAVFLKGAALSGDSIPDIYVEKDRQVILRAPRIDSPAVHGSGCVLSAAIAARLALGVPRVSAVIVARVHVRNAIATAPRLGKGIPPTDLQARAGLLEMPRLNRPSTWSRRSWRIIAAASVLLLLTAFSTPIVTQHAHAGLLWTLAGALLGLLVGLGLLSVRMDAAEWRTAFQSFDAQAKTASSSSAPR